MGFLKKLNSPFSQELLPLMYLLNIIGRLPLPMHFWIIEFWLYCNIDFLRSLFSHCCKSILFLEIINCHFVVLNIRNQVHHFLIRRYTKYVCILLFCYGDHQNKIVNSYHYLICVTREWHFCALETRERNFVGESCCLVTDITNTYIPTLTTPTQQNKFVTCCTCWNLF